MAISDEKRVDNHQKMEDQDAAKAIKFRQRGVQLEREKQGGSRGNKKQPPPHSRH